MKPHMKCSARYLAHVCVPCTATGAVIASSQKCIGEDFCGCVILLPRTNRPRGGYLAITGTLYSTVKEEVGTARQRSSLLRGGGWASEKLPGARRDACSC